MSVNFPGRPSSGGIEPESSSGKPGHSVEQGTPPEPQQLPQFKGPTGAPPKRGTSSGAQATFRQSASASSEASGDRPPTPIFQGTPEFDKKWAAAPEPSIEQVVKGQPITGSVLRLVDAAQDSDLFNKALNELPESVLGWMPAAHTQTRAAISKLWQQQVENGTRILSVVMPAEGAEVPDEPLGIMSIYEGHLTNPTDYVRTLDPAEYPGKRRAGQASFGELYGRGLVLETATYFNTDKLAGEEYDYPGGVLNNFAKLAMIELAMQKWQSEDGAVPHIFSRVDMGSPPIPPTENDPGSAGRPKNAKSASQMERMSDGGPDRDGGPIAVVEERSFRPGEETRYVAIYEISAEGFRRSPNDLRPFRDDGPSSLTRLSEEFGLQKIIEGNNLDGKWIGAIPPRQAEADRKTSESLNKPSKAVQSDE